jgi:hypothetical protein
MPLRWILLAVASTMFALATSDIVYTYGLLFGKLLQGGLTYSDLRPKYWLYVTNKYVNTIHTRYTNHQLLRIKCVSRRTASLPMFCRMGIQETDPLGASCPPNSSNRCVSHQAMFRTRWLTHNAFNVAQSAAMRWKVAALSYSRKRGYTSR